MPWARGRENAARWGGREVIAALLRLRGLGLLESRVCLCQLYLIRRVTLFLLLPGLLNLQLLVLTVLDRRLQLVRGALRTRGGIAN